jgi:hypothetical protein
MTAPGAPAGVASDDSVLVDAAPALNGHTPRARAASLPTSSAPRSPTAPALPTGRISPLPELDLSGTPLGLLSTSRDDEDDIMDYEAMAEDEGAPTIPPSSRASSLAPSEPGAPAAAPSSAAPPHVGVVTDRSTASSTWAPSFPQPYPPPHYGPVPPYAWTPPPPPPQSMSADVLAKLDTILRDQDVIRTRLDEVLATAVNASERTAAVERALTAPQIPQTAHRARSPPRPRSPPPPRRSASPGRAEPYRGRDDRGEYRRPNGANNPPYNAPYAARGRSDHRRGNDRRYESEWRPRDDRRADGQNRGPRRESSVGRPPVAEHTPMDVTPPAPPASSTGGGTAAAAPVVPDDDGIDIIMAPAAAGIAVPRPQTAAPVPPTPTPNAPNGNLPDDEWTRRVDDATLRAMRARPIPEDEPSLLDVAARAQTEFAWEDFALAKIFASRLGQRRRDHYPLSAAQALFLDRAWIGAPWYRWLTGQSSAATPAPTRNAEPVAWFIWMNIHDQSTFIRGLPITRAPGPVPYPLTDHLAACIAGRDWILSMRPRGGSSALNFVAFACEFFSRRRGLLAALISRAGLAVSPLEKADPFPSDRDLTEDALLAHCAACGLTPAAAGRIEAFVLQWIAHGKTPREGRGRD